MIEREIFAAAMQLGSQAERADYLQRVCGDDRQLRSQVEALLAEHDKLGSFLESPLGVQTLDMPAEEAPERPGTQIGPYKLLQILGEGGMGVVYLADQVQPVVRRVALKIIKPGMDTRQVIARFEAERQALALMDHPNIAKVLDAGATPSGRPYFVMELVKGVPITQYCDQQRLTPNDRLELFMLVCQAVQHAHQKGVIHRDLKPSNVLIALYDGRPVPKIIDFGLAKATSQRLTEKTMFTAVGSIVGTLEYMAPEQAELNNLDIDTRADIYSLGVILYELLTGSPPFSARQLRSAGFTEMLRMIREQEPPRPSTKISSSEELPSIAANRHLEPQRLTRQVQGDLDWIVMKCLEKQRERRYETANGLALELERYLQNKPVLAGPPSSAYRLRKFWQRNRTSVLVAAALVLLLISGIAASTWQAVRAMRAETLARQNEGKAIAETHAKEQARQAAVASERRALSAAEAEREARQAAVEAATAEREAKQQALEAVEAEQRKAKEAEAAQRRQAEAVASLLESLFSHASTREYAGAPDFKQIIAQRLDKLAQSLDKDFAGEPLTRARLRTALGSAQWHLGDNGKASRLLEQAWQERKAHLGGNHRDTLHTLTLLASTRAHALEYEKALEAQRELYRLLGEKFGPGDPQTLNAGLILVGYFGALKRSAEATALCKQIMERSRERADIDHGFFIFAQAFLGHTLSSLGELEVGRAHIEDSLARARTAFGERNHRTIQLKRDLGHVYQKLGNLNRMIELNEEIVRDLESAPETRPGDLTTALIQLAMVYGYAARRDEEIATLERCVQLESKSYAPDEQFLVGSRKNLANAYSGKGRHDQAQAIWEPMVAGATAKHGAQHPRTIALMQSLGREYVLSSRPDDALKIQEQIVEAYRARGEIDQAVACWPLLDLASSYLTAGRLAESRALLDSLWDRIGKRPVLEVGGVNLSSVATFLMQLYDKSGEPEKTQTLVESYLTQQRRRYADDPRGLAEHLTTYNHNLLISWYAGALVEPLLREALTLWEEKLPNDSQKHDAQGLLGLYLARQKQDVEAEPLLLAGYAGLRQQESLRRRTLLSRIASQLVQLYGRQNQPDEVRHWREEEVAIAALGKPAQPAPTAPAAQENSGGPKPSLSRPPKTDPPMPSPARAPAATSGNESAAQQIKRLTERLKEAPDDLEAYRSRAFAHLLNNDLNGMLADCLAGLERKPDYPPLLAFAAQAYGRLKQWDKSRQVARQLLSLEANASNQPLIGNACHELSNYYLYFLNPPDRPAELAVELSERAVAFSTPRSNDWICRTSLGTAYLRAGRFDQAARTLEASLEAATAADQPFSVVFYLAMAEHHRGNAAKARQHLAEGQKWVAEHEATLRPSQQSFIRKVLSEAEALLREP